MLQDDIGRHFKRSRCNSKLEDDYDNYPDHGSILFHQEKLIDGRGKRSTGW
jgi:hypothetical protein